MCTVCMCSSNYVCNWFNVYVWQVVLCLHVLQQLVLFVAQPAGVTMCALCACTPLIRSLSGSMCRCGNLCYFFSVLQQLGVLVAQCVGVAMCALCACALVIRYISGLICRRGNVCLLCICSSS